jgi:hypothetical protein
MQNKREAWLKDFENKEESELKAMRAPPGLPTLYLNMWHRDRDAALSLLRAGNDEQSDMDIEQEKARVEAALSALENADVPPKPANDVLLQTPLEIPKGNAADLLERQIGTCAALIGNIADYIARNDSNPDVCFPFMDRISSLLSSSATAARVVGQLRGIATETKQTFVKKIEGEREGGVPQP